MEPRKRNQIEHALGRQLTSEELAPASSLDDLSTAHIGVIKRVAPKQLVACINYISAIVPDAVTPDIAKVVYRYADADEPAVAGPSLLSLPLFERYVGRQLRAGETSRVATLDELSPEQLTVASVLCRAEPLVGELYLQQLAPDAPAQSRAELVSRLTKDV
jgi:hypothetical protein